MSTRPGFPVNMKFLLASAILVSLTYIPGDLSNQFTPTAKVHASSEEKSPAPGRDLPGPTVANSSILFYSALTVAAKSSPLPPYVGAAEGTAVVLKEQTARSEFVPIKTSLPVFKSFGLSAKNRLLLYSPLKKGVPSGELYIEDLATTKLRKISSRVVLEAAWSPTDPARIAYTFATGEGFGLGLTDLNSGETTLIPEGVFAEAIQWDDAGTGLHYFAAENQNLHLHLTAKFVSVGGSSRSKPLPSVPAGFPTLTEKAWSGDGGPGFAEGKEPSVMDQYAFRIISADREHEVLGDSFLGNSTLRARSLSTGLTNDLGTGRLLKVLPEGVIITQLTTTGSALQYVNWAGQTTAVASTTVAYNLPLQNSILTQGGASYASPGNCLIKSHGGVMEYAYDFRGTIGAHVLAAADGLVVSATSTVTCNTIDTDCTDFSPTGCSGTYFGNVIIIQHADGSFAKYAHLETGSVQVAVGTSVCQGLYIGRQGHTGSTSGTFNTCGDHLHFQRQSSPDFYGQSIPVDFSDVPSNPLACNATYVSNSIEKSHSISPSSQSFAIGGGTGTVNVTSTGCSWSAISNDSWITITSSDNGTGNGLVSFAVADNSASGPRLGTMNLGGHLFTVNQDGGGITNQAPMVNAGSDQMITLPGSASLTGTSTDDGLPNPPGAMTGTWAIVSGPGTVSFGNENLLNTTASFSIAGIYVLRLTISDGALSSSDEITIIVNGNSGGLLSTSFGAPEPNINLTTEGTADWAHWGLTTSTSFNHKSGVAQQISDYTRIGSITAIRYVNSLISYNWSNGTPTAGANNTTTGIYAYEVGNGFQVTVPADLNARTLRLYVGLFAARGKLEAFLSDGSASPFIDTSLVNQSGPTNRVYTLNYLAGSAGQTLTVKWTAITTFHAVGNVTLQAASLVNSGSSNQAPIVSAGSDQTITLPANADLSGTATDDGLPNPPGVLASTWSKVSGPGTVTFANANALATTASFSTAGLYTLRLTADDGALPVSDDVDVTVNASLSGLLDVSTGTPSAAIDLTAEGTADWAHWGLTTSTSFNHKSGVAQQISNYTRIGSITPVRYANSLISYNWADGTPTTAISNTTTGVYVSGVNNGFQVTVPADMNARTLRLYVGAWRARGKLEAFLSDGSASPFIDTSLVNQAGTTTNRVYTLNYLAGSAGQTLTVKWTAQTTFVSSGNVTLQAASQ